jgi:subtilisin family serine protease
MDGRIDPTFEFLESQINRYGRQAPIFGRGLSFSQSMDGTAALLHFTRLLRADEIKRLEVAGVVFARRGSCLLHVGTIYSVWVPFSALETLRETGILLRAEATWSPFILQPLDLTTATIGAVNARLLPILGVDGSGVLIADIDSGVDPTHPHFFRADGGHYSWIDVNANGIFDNGRDAVDLNRNGREDSNERLVLMDGAAVHNGQTDNKDGVFQAKLDWLFADQNSDRIRNVGLADGFSEDDLTWGEPIFVLDDVNGNDALDPNELLVRLGSSKVRALISDDAIYERGKNLIDAPNDPNFDFFYHGTGVASILLGGQAPHARQGVAPGAELITYAASELANLNQNFETSRQFDALADAVERGAKIVLHEWTDPFRVPQDGSTLFETALTTSRAQGVIHVTPAGNLNLSGKHLETLSIAGAPTDLPFKVPTQIAGVLINSAFGSLMWQGPAGSLEITSPSGTRVAVVPGPPVQIDTDLFVQTTFEMTSRGFAHLQFFLWMDDGSLPAGEWTLHVTTSTTTTIFGRITDYFSGWGVGIGWGSPTVDHGTLVHPSTADAGIAVAASAGRWDINGDSITTGTVRGFSGRGPRMDGVLALDIAAPDDPYAAISATPQFIEAGYERHWLATFGGTSGAGPHVAGAFALLMQAFPDEDADALESRLLSNAAQNGLDASFGAEFPNANVGYGRLDVFAALGDQTQPPTSNRPPDVEVFAEILDGQSILNTIAVDPDGDEISFRYDWNHDGEFDTEWSQDSIWRGPAVDAKYARVEVRDVFGASRGALIEWPTRSAGDDEPDVGPPISSPPDDCDGCATTSPSNGLLWLVALLGFGRKRRFSRLT